MQLVIPSHVTEIKNKAYYDCSGQFVGMIPVTVTSVVISEGVTSIGSGAFLGCSGLEYIEIPESVVSIGMMAFFCCSSLVSIDIPKSVTSIESNAFFKCSKLESAALPGTLTSVGQNVFTSCSSLGNQKEIEALILRVNESNQKVLVSPTDEANTPSSSSLSTTLIVAGVVSLSATAFCLWAFMSSSALAVTVSTAIVAALPVLQIALPATALVVLLGFGLKSLATAYSGNRSGFFSEVPPLQGSDGVCSRTQGDVAKLLLT